MTAEWKTNPALIETPLQSSRYRNRVFGDWIAFLWTRRFISSQRALWIVGQSLIASRCMMCFGHFV
jgi:hypothetical protein